MKRPHGFTLLELTVALTMALVVTSAALGVLLLVLETQREGAVRNSLARDAQYTMDTLARDLTYLGVGVPRGVVREEDGDVYSAAPVDQLRPLVRIGLRDYLAFVGDLPFPNADLNGLASPTFLDGDRHRVGVSSELSFCTPPENAPQTGNYRCSSTKSSLIPTGDATDCDKDATGAATCPWGLGKWQNAGSGQPAVLVFGDAEGGWYPRQLHESSPFDARQGRTVIHLRHLSDAEELPMNRFYGNVFGAASIAQLDRVFYSLENPDRTRPCTSNCSLRRRQCWGGSGGSALDLIGEPGNNNWPKVGAAAIPSGSTPDLCNAGLLQGTDWETIMDGIESLTFRYYLDETEELVPPLDLEKSALTRFVEVDLTMKRAVPGTSKIFTHRITRRFFLPNWGGIVHDDDGDGTNDINPANGGCLTPSATRPYDSCQ